MAVAFPVGIGLALVLGVVVNYLKLPVGNPELIFGGVAFIVLAILLNATAYRNQNKEKGKISYKGLLLSVISGVLMGLFYKYVASAMFTNFYQPEPGKLSPYTAVVIFGVGVLISNFFFNTILMKRPVTGTQVSYKDYFKGNFGNHLTGILGSNYLVHGHVVQYYCF